MNVYGRGFDTVELNLTTCTLSNFRNFDTCSSSYSIIAYLNGLRSGTIVAATTTDDAATNLTPDAKTALSNIGVNVGDLQIRGKVTFVAQVGLPRQAAYKVAFPGGNPLTMSVIVKGNEFKTF